jgi:hypothetical protein
MTPGYDELLDGVLMCLKVRLLGEEVGRAARLARDHAPTLWPLAMPFSALAALRVAFSLAPHLALYLSLAVMRPRSRGICLMPLEWPMRRASMGPGVKFSPGTVIRTVMADTPTPSSTSDAAAPGASMRTV